jgi:hypothetical protein
MKKIRMYRVGMNGWQITLNSIEDALKKRPAFEFLEKKLRDAHPFEEVKESPAIAPVKLAPEFDYNALSEKEKKEHLEVIGKEHGVDIDKRKKLSDLEEIIDKLLEE